MVVYFSGVILECVAFFTSLLGLETLLMSGGWDGVCVTFWQCLLCPQSPSQGASMVLYTALSPSLEGERGGYWSNGHTEMPTPNTYNPRLQLGLWDFSCRLVSLQEQHQPWPLTSNPWALSPWPWHKHCMDETQHFICHPAIIFVFTISSPPDCDWIKTDDQGWTVIG